MAALALDHLNIINLANLPDTQACSSLTNKFVAMPSIALFVYDTLVILAVTYRLAADTVTGDSWCSRILSVIYGKGLFSLSRALMRSGQLYYL